MMYNMSIFYEKNITKKIYLYHSSKLKNNAALSVMKACYPAPCPRKQGSFSILPYGNVGSGIKKAVTGTALAGKEKD